MLRIFFQLMPCTPDLTYTMVSKKKRIGSFNQAYFL